MKCLFFIIIILETDNLFDWLKYSIDLLKTVKGDDQDVEFISERKEHAVLK